MTTYNVGETSIAGSLDSGNAGEDFASKYALGVNATLVSISFYTGNVAGQVNLAVCKDDAGGSVPGTVVQRTGLFTPSANSWNTIPVTPTACLSGNYWIVWSVTSNTTQYPVYTGSAIGSVVQDDPTTAIPLPWTLTATIPDVHWAGYATFDDAPSGGDEPKYRAEAPPADVLADLPQKRRCNVAALVAAAIVSQPPLALHRTIEDRPLEERPIRLPKRLPESVDAPQFLLWALLDDAPPFEFVQRARRSNPISGPAVAVTLLARCRTTPDLPLPEPRIARLSRLPESVDQPPPERIQLTADTAPEDRGIARGRWVLPSGAAPAQDQPLSRWRTAFEAPIEEAVQRLLRRLPESVDQPPLVRERPVYDTPFEDLVVRLRGRAPESVDDPPLVRERPVQDTPPEDLVPRLRCRAPESVDQPPIVRLRITSDTPAEDVRIRLRGELADSVDQPPFPRLEIIGDTALEDFARRRAYKLPDPLVTPVDAPPAPRWRSTSDTPAEDLRSARGRWVLPSGAAPPPDQPLKRWRTSFEPVLEEARIRLPWRFPESVDQPPLRRTRSIAEPVVDEPRIRLAACQAWAFVQADGPLLFLRRVPIEQPGEELAPRLRRVLPDSVDVPAVLPRARRAPLEPLEELQSRRLGVPYPQPADAPPLKRWSSVYDTPLADGFPRRLMRLPESYVPPPVDDPPLTRWATIDDTPLEDLPLRRYRLLLESGEPPPVFVLVNDRETTFFRREITTIKFRRNG